MKKTALMASVAFGVALVAQARAGENAVPGADIAPYIDLKTVREHPTAYQGAPFQFDGQFYSIGTLFSPFYSVFEAGRYVNFSVWDDSDELWTSRGYTSAYPLLYLSRARTNDVGKLTKLQRFDRFHATAIVRATVGSFAFVEVLALEPLDRKVTPLALHHMIRGFRHKSAQEFDMAALQFADAFDDVLPDHLLALVRREEGECYLATGNYEQAVVAFDSAREYDSNSLELKGLYEHAVALQTSAEEHLEARHSAPPPAPAAHERPAYEPFPEQKAPATGKQAPAPKPEADPKAGEAPPQQNQDQTTPPQDQPEEEVGDGEGDGSDDGGTPQEDDGDGG